MNALSIFGVALAIFLYSSLSKKLERSLLTAPMVFMFAGFLFGPWGMNFSCFDRGYEYIHVLAEFTLMIILFIDASRINLNLLYREHSLPIRLLGIGMPLSIIIGTFWGAWMLDLNLWEASVLAALLAPTDAALGNDLFKNKQVPIRVRQTLNIESGLNDGLALPIVLTLLAFTSFYTSEMAIFSWVAFTAKQIIFGPLIGMIVGLFGGRFFAHCIAQRWIDKSTQGFVAPSLALVAYGGAILLGGNGFIASFVAGLVLGNTFRPHCDELYRFSEREGMLLNFLTFTTFGAVMVPEAVAYLDIYVLMYAILSLTLIRGLAVVLSLFGSKLQLGTVYFFSWFGPRGVASILFSLLVLEKSGLPTQNYIAAVVTTTVLISVVAHGMSAAPLSSLYVSYLKKRKKRFKVIEDRKVKEMHIRCSH